MSDMTRYTIDTEVRCQGQVSGRLVRVVIDPVAGRLTHLVVEPEHGRDVARLVPIELADAASAAPDILLTCSAAEFAALDPAEETEFLPGGGTEFGYQSEQAMMWPHYLLGAAGLGGAVLAGDLGGETRPTTYDCVPRGEVQVRRGERVEATDGEIGKVQGLIIDPRDHAVTHVLLEEGHLWGRKTVAIPIRTVTYTDGSVRVELSKTELGDLPPVDFDRRS
ncbi:PRC-barrel domain-containing protein [Streptacidiphilus albus]|uniref:PRC-barrel domain-containing protein n=1 Tax=Streptacidiphilus albus TaxID=105425 RepID=UPI0009E008E7|nr:PRC-barrel domain-containing protein [Streptacidiphilus albus]